MAFTRIDGFEAQIFIPGETAEAPKKHNCRDCYICQMCSDERCEACLKRTACQERERNKLDPANE